MPAVQSSYQERIDEFYEGQIINPHTCDVSTYIASATTGFGVAVRRGGADNECQPGVRPNSGNANVGGTSNYGVDDFLGISIKDPTRDPEDDDEYSKGAHVNVLWRGDIVVKAGVAVAAGDPARIKVSDNTWVKTAAAAGIRNLGPLNGQTAIFMKDAAAAALTIVRLYGTEQRIKSG